mgnify:CR=1 FL=1
MSLRLIDVYLPAGEDSLDDLDVEARVLDRRVVTLDEGRLLVRLLVSVEHTEGLLDALQNRVGSNSETRMIVTEVEATLPRPETDEPDDAATDAENDDEATPGRVSREELYQDIAEEVGVGWVHYALVVLSVVVAAGGMLRNDVAVVIGAMVIAPLIGPNIALALGTTLADGRLLKRAGWVNVLGLGIGFALAFGLGLVLTVDTAIPEIASRTRIGLPDAALALAAGTAGALAMAKGVSTALVGVMVAVALVPPLVAVGLLAGGGQWILAYRAVLLLTTNVVCINLSAVATFLVLGIRPMSWYEAKQARRSTRWALALWTLVLAILALAIWLAQS